MSTVQDFETEERFTVNDDASATWAMRRFKSQVEKMRENERLAKAELDRVSRWLESVNKPLVASAEYFEGLLLAYAREQREKGRKSIQLIDGTIKSRQNAGRVEVDESIFLPWAKAERPDLLTFPEPKPNKTAIKAENDIPGVVVIEGQVSFSIEVSE